MNSIIQNTSLARMVFTGCAVGAATMYMMDPRMGRRRRAHTRDKMFHYSRAANRMAQKKRRHLRNVGHGMMHEFGKKMHVIPRQRAVLSRVSPGRGQAASRAEGIVSFYDRLRRARDRFRSEPQSVMPIVNSGLLICLAGIVVIRNRGMLSIGGYSAPKGTRQIGAPRTGVSGSYVQHAAIRAGKPWNPELDPRESGMAA